eukprot:1721675-Prorocentrum_lima.AAC.1
MAVLASWRPAPPSHCAWLKRCGMQATNKCGQIPAALSAGFRSFQHLCEGPYRRIIESLWWPMGYHIPL